MQAHHRVHISTAYIRNSFSILSPHLSIYFASLPYFCVICLMLSLICVCTSMVMSRVRYCWSHISSANCIGNVTRRRWLRRLLKITAPGAARAVTQLPNNCAPVHDACCTWFSSVFHMAILYCGAIVEGSVFVMHLFQPFLLVFLLIYKWDTATEEGGKWSM